MKKFGYLSLAAAAAMLLSVGPSLAGDSAPPKAGVQPQHGIPAAACRAGYVQQGTRLCMTGTQTATSFTNAQLRCMDIRGRVADYHDWRYRIFRGDGLPAPVGFWLGEITDDNAALFVNSNNVGDFDGQGSRFDTRGFVCAHDRS
jgi:hypothetical protein